MEGLWGHNKGFTAVLEKQIEEWELHYFQLQPYWEITKNFKRFWQHCCAWDGHDCPAQQHLFSSSLQSSQEWVITCVRAAEGVEWHLTSWCKAAMCCYKEKLGKWEEWELRKTLKDKGRKVKKAGRKKRAMSEEGRIHLREYEEKKSLNNGMEKGETIVETLPHPLKSWSKHL